MSARLFLDLVEHNRVYWAAVIFFAAYPLVAAVMWITTSITYFARREFRKDDAPPDLEVAPPVSILIACYCEEETIAGTIEACMRLDYPDVEIVLVDDGSTDRTRDVILPYAEAGRVRLLAKAQNEGKAMALNDAFPILRGDIVVVMDADAQPDPNMLKHLVPHFSSPRVAAVTGNPRVVDRDTLLAKLQTIEFTSIVSVQRRAQRIWGRILTMSGVVTALRRSAVMAVGLYSPDMATEDIDLTWRLQMQYYDVRYEPHAVVWMRVPRRFRDLWRQRRRWALGLSQVFRRHGLGVLRWKRRRMWPVAVESGLSILWAYVFVCLTALWTFGYAVHRPLSAASPIPNWWGMVIATMALLQLGTGVMLDRHYDRSVLRAYPVAVIYPIVYWMLMAVITVRTTPIGLFRHTRHAPTKWRTPRKPTLAAAGSTG